MTPARRAKIKALADDERGNAAIRVVAQRLLQRYPAPEPSKPSRVKLGQLRVPGVERSPEYLKFLFMDLNRWKPTVRDTLLHYTSYKGTPYSFLLFKARKSQGWGWRRLDLRDDTETFSQVKYDTRTEAHQAAWKSLES